MEDDILCGQKNNNINYYRLLPRISEICFNAADTADGGCFLRSKAIVHLDPLRNIKFLKNDVTKFG